MSERTCTVVVNGKAMTYQNRQEATRQAATWVRQSLERATRGPFRVMYLGRTVSVGTFANGGLDVIVTDPWGRAELPSASAVRAWYADGEASWWDLAMPAR